MESRLGRLLSAGIIALELAAGACSPQQERQVFPTPTRPAAVAGPQAPERAPLVASSLEEWRTAPSLTRIQELELKRHPSFAEFDSRQELALASAEFYCEQTKCNVDPKQMAQNIFFVTPNKFLEEAQKDVNRVFTEAERNDQLETRLEMVNEKTGESFVNSDLLKQLVERAKQDSPDTAATLQRRNVDFETVYIKSLFFHVYAHMNQRKDTYTFSPFSMIVPTRTEGLIKVPRIGKLEGFTFVGEREDGKPFYINGAKEGITERDAQIVGNRSGSYMTLTPDYRDVAGIIAQLNRMSGITDDEFLNIAHGHQDVKNMFQKWATLNKNRPDEKTGVLALVAAGLQIDLGGSRAETLKSIAGFAGIRLQ